MAIREKLFGTPALCVAIFGVVPLVLAYFLNTVCWGHGIVPNVYPRNRAVTKICKGISDQIARNILRDLKKGYGVEDIAARGTASADQARAVITFMQKHGLTERFYGKGQINANDNGSGNGRT